MPRTLRDRDSRIFSFSLFSPEKRVTKRKEKKASSDTDDDSAAAATTSAPKQRKKKRKKKKGGKQNKKVESFGKVKPATSRDGRYRVREGGIFGAVLFFALLKAI